MSNHLLDCVIIGGGPAGIAVGHTLKNAGLTYCILDKGPVANHVAQYPTFMRFFSTNENLEIAGFPLGITEEKPTRREYLLYLTKFIQFHGLDVRTHTEVTGAVKRADGLFEVKLARGGEPEKALPSLLARTVVAAVGAWEQPRRLGVPGDELPKVRYRFTDSHEYVGKRVLIIGGRNSAVETALILWRAGAHVSLSYRGREFNGRGVKYWLRPDIDNRIKNGEITAYLASHVTRIDDDSVSIHLDTGRDEAIPNDFVLPFLGYDPPVAFLRSLGVQLEPETNRPAHNPETLETNVPGLYIAGVITEGNVSGHVFIENSRHHGELILKGLRRD